jgi:hypothetical protein
MSGEAGAGGGGEANGVQPNVTIYINNLNEKTKLEGTAPLPEPSRLPPHPPAV